MTDLTPWLHALATRAEWLALLVPLGWLLGDIPARLLGLRWLATRLSARITRVSTKLDRRQRSIATRIYRGLIATGAFLLPALLLGYLLTLGGTLGSYLILLGLLAFLGHHFRSVWLWKHWQRARRGTLGLTLGTQLFADQHGLLRALIRQHGAGFITLLGGSFWFWLADAPGLGGYAMLQLLAQHYRNHIFGWATQALYRLAQLPVMLLAFLLLPLAACFVPGCHPFAARRARSLPGLWAALLHIALEQADHTGQLHWHGRGTARLEPAHLLRFLLLILAASALFVLLLSSPRVAEYAKLLFFN